MIRFKLRDRVAERELATGQRVQLIEIAEATGIGRITLSRMLNQKGHHVRTDTLERLCRYFDCRIADLVEYVAD